MLCRMFWLKTRGCPLVFVAYTVFKVRDSFPIVLQWFISLTHIATRNRYATLSQDSTLI
nr:MAG TPA: hypothetical protein [Bacteriophage sp.]